MSDDYLRCQHCGGNIMDPDHYCDSGEDELPLLASGLVDETYATSHAAAERAADKAATQRAKVYALFRAAGNDGHTDDEIQVLMGMDGSSERPRRWELWKMSAIEIKRDAQGKAVKRLTRRKREAVVWIASEFAAAAVA